MPLTSIHSPTDNHFPDSISQLSSLFKKKNGEKFLQKELLPQYTQTNNLWHFFFRRADQFLHLIAFFSEISITKFIYFSILISSFTIFLSFPLFSRFLVDVVKVFIRLVYIFYHVIFSFSSNNSEVFLFLLGNLLIFYFLF